VSEEDMTLSWFNISAPPTRPFGVFVRAFNAFNRRCADGDHYWGFGLLQIGHRHLFYVGHSGVSVLFVGRVP
jgi:hypothetical protein